MTRVYIEMLVLRDALRDIARRLEFWFEIPCSFAHAFFRGREELVSGCTKDVYRDSIDHFSSR